MYKLQKKYFVLLPAVFLTVFLSFVFSDWYINHRISQPSDIHTDNIKKEAIIPQDTPAVQETVANPVDPAQENNHQEEIINCKAKLYSVKATKEQCNQIEVLDARAQGRIDGLEQEAKTYNNENEKKMKKCDNASTSVYQIVALTKCYKALEDDTNKIYKEKKSEEAKIKNDLGDTIDKLIK